MRSTKLLPLAVVALVSGCTSVLVPRVEHPPAPDPEPTAEPETRLSIARVALSIEGAPAIVLEEDGRIAHPACEGRLDQDGTVHDRNGATVLRLTPSGAIVDRDGRGVYTIEGSTLRRASGGSARLDGARVTFEGSPDLALDVERAGGADDRTVLLLVAAMSACEEP